MLVVLQGDEVPGLNYICLHSTRISEETDPRPFRSSSLIMAPYHDVPAEHEHW